MPSTAKEVYAWFAALEHKPQEADISFGKFSLRVKDGNVSVWERL